MDTLTTTAKGTFMGLAAVFGARDRDYNWAMPRVPEFAPGAFTKALAIAEANQLTSRQPICALVFCNANNPIGAITSARETKDGLLVEGVIDLDHREGQRAFSAIQKGYVNSLSVISFPRKMTANRITEASLSAVSVGLLGFGGDSRTMIDRMSIKTVQPHAGVDDHTATDDRLLQVLREMTEYCRERLAMRPGAGVVGNPPKWP